MMLLGKRQAALLSELQGRVKQRWKSQAREAFSCIAMGGVGHMIGRGELRGILSGLSMHASTQDFEELWAVFCERPGEPGDKAGNSSGAPWADVRAILGVDDAERRMLDKEAEAVKRREEIKTRKHTSPKKKGGQPLRDAKADPWESMTDGQAQNISISQTQVPTPQSLDTPIFSNPKSFKPRFSTPLDHWL
jgi:hypothetical protein